MSKWLFVLAFFVLTTAHSQELNCRVIINADRVQSGDPAAFKDMEIAFAEFMNNTKWTQDEFQSEERINCNILVSLAEDSDPTVGVYTASVQILSSRPVFNSNYESVVFNFADRDWTFEYNISQPIIFNQNSFIDNISSLLSYYAYVIIGMDYDSFGKLSGDEYFDIAWRIVTNAQQSGYPGWEQFNSVRNRYWLTENLINSQMAPIREASYEYHLQGLDTFWEKPDEARSTISNSIKKVLNVNQVRPRSILTISFLDAKKDELSHIFSQGDTKVRRSTYNMLINIDPTLRETIEPMIK